MARARDAATPEPAKPLTLKRLEELAGERIELDEARLEHDRAARRAAATIELLDAQLLTEMRRRKVEELKVGRYGLVITHRAGSLYYKGKLLEVLGQDKFDALLADLPKVARLDFTDYGEPKSRTRRNRRKKAA